MRQIQAKKKKRFINELVNKRAQKKIKLSLSSFYRLGNKFDMGLTNKLISY